MDGAGHVGGGCYGRAMDAVGHVGGCCYGHGMDGHVGGGCYAPGMDEARAETAAKRPGVAGRGCCDRLDTGTPIEVTAAAAALVAAVAGARRGAGPSFTDRTNPAWVELEKRLELVTKAADMLGSRIPRVHDSRFARQIARGLDALLCNVSAGHGALDLAIGDGLDALDTGRKAMHLGYSNIGDYAREELGLNASTAAKKMRLARKLRDRPLVREAVRRGEITPRKAEIIAHVAVGQNQTRWILRAKAESVRALRKAVSARPDPDDEEWLSIAAAVRPEQQPILDEGLRWGGIVLGARSKRVERVEAWGQEFLGAHTVPGHDDRADDVHFTSNEDVEWAEALLEREARLWSHLAAVDPLKAPEFSGEIDPWRIDGELKAFMEMRSRWDEVFGRVALPFKQCRAWDPLGFASFGHYCEERLGMAKRTVAQRVALEWSLRRMPLLRQALREKRITYEKARIIARHVEGGHADEVRPLIAKAEAVTCIDLREQLEVKAEGQMCAQGIFTVTMPAHVAELLKDAFRALRAVAKRWISLGECIAAMAEYFTLVWKKHAKEIRSARRRILMRDRHRCQVPGCSRPAVHVHHIEFRAQGGDDDPSNLISLCAAHHLYGIHEELMRVTGTAPDRLVWEFGLRRSYAETAVP